MASSLLCEKIARRISSTPFSKIICFDSVSSTNSVITELALPNHDEEFVVLADTQTGGKGRHGRSWFSPPGKNIYMSLLLRPYVDIRQASTFAILTAVSICEALRNITGLEIGIKWPNDLVMNGKKLGGILIETRSEHSVVSMAVIGVGLNIALARDDLPDELRGKATSLFMETGMSFDREEIVVKILGQLSTRYRRLFVPTADTPVRRVDQGERAHIIEAWKSLDTVLGRNISVTTSKGRLTGKAIDIDESGMLDLLCDDGKLEKIHTGDIIIL